MNDANIQESTPYSDEIRGVWIASVENIDFPSKPGLDAGTLRAELDDILRTAMNIGLNALYFQVRPSCDALYRSAIFPVSAYLAGEQGGELPSGFDPLEYLVAAAHKNGIAVHAWINPLRITMGSPEEPRQDVTQLAPSNPARLHPEWTVPYSDGKLYFNAGLPEVRRLVAEGITEIMRNYAVDGVIFDDYFYPYPGPGGEFDDSAAFAAYGDGFTDRNDWRRGNINAIVRACHNAVKEVNPNAVFGISPFGIWQNDNGTNGGSETNGLNAYSAIYCDALTWIREGTVDYIAPQLYWKFSFEAARFDTLCRWWNAQLGAYPGVKLLICHGAYRSKAWEDDGEIRRQISFAREEKSYAGNIQFGYKSIRGNEENLIGQLRSLYDEPYPIKTPVSSGMPVVIGSPTADRPEMDCDHTYLTGKSDPYYSLTCNGTPVSQTRLGYFTVFLPLPDIGENRFVFRQSSGSETVFTVLRKAPAAEESAASPETSPADIPETDDRDDFPSPRAICVTAEETRLKASPDSSYYDDLGFVRRGTTAWAVGMRNGCYLLSDGAYIREECAELTDQTLPQSLTVTRAEASVTADGRNLLVRIPCGAAVPMTAEMTENGFEITLRGTVLSESEVPTVIHRNPLVNAISFRQAKAGAVCILTLFDPLNFYGYDFCNADGVSIVSLVMPRWMSENKNRPLTGKRIVLDAGHGGGESGAPGPDSGFREKDFNLAIVLAAEKKLQALGAEVLLTRANDSEVWLTTGDACRCAIIDRVRPDLSFSVHHDSIGYYADVTKLHGLLSLYYEPSGRLASQIALETMSELLGRHPREARRQCLAMCRNPHFPAMLVEVGYTTCPEEMNFARTAYGAEKAGEAVTASILRFFRQMDAYLCKFTPKEEFLS